MSSTQVSSFEFQVSFFTAAYITKNNAIWQEATQTVYPDFNSDRAVITAKSRRKLTNLGAFSSVSEAEDIRGNVTTSTQTVDRNTGMAVSTTTVLSSVQPQLQTQQYGQLVESVSTSAVTNRYAYDGLNRRVAVMDGRGNTSTTTYNALGQVVYVEDAATNRTTYVYDDYGRQIETLDALNQSTYTVYDLRGNVIRQYGATYPVWYEYDAEGRMVAMATTRDTGLDPATVDSLDNPSLDKTQWLYDPATDLLVQKLYDDGKGPSYTYTPDGKLATRTWARGVVTEYGYDGAGELASVHYSDGTQPILKTYNRLGNPVMIVSAGTTNTFEYSATTLEKISDTQLGYAIRRGHDNLGRMESLSITNHYDGAYGYDVFGRMAEVSFEGLDFHYAYLPGSDLVNGLTYGAVKKTVAFEAHRNLVTGISYHTIADTLIAERTYTYNALGNVVARTRQRGAGPVETDDFDHNLRSELIAASLGGTNAASGTYGYAFDPIGNRVVSTNRSDVTAYASNELNQYTNIISEAPFIPEFDDDGNQTLVKTSTGIWHVTYNAENRPVVWSNATAVIAMDYDFMGRRVSKRLLAGEGETVNRQFLYDGYLQIAAIETNALVTTTFWDPTERIATRPLAMKDGSFIYTYTHDLTKNVMEILDSTGAPVVVYDYDAFGTMTASRLHLNRFGFSSEYHDAALGCVYYNYRHYNPLDGRWTSRDPMGEPESLNCQMLVENSPINKYDYVGFMTCDCCKKELADVLRRNQALTSFMKNLMNQRRPTEPFGKCLDKVRCGECLLEKDKGMGGFYADHPNPAIGGKTIQICCGEIPGYSGFASTNTVEGSLYHELQHADDWCKGKLDQDDCQSVLCSELRSFYCTSECTSNDTCIQELEKRGYFKKPPCSGIKDANKVKALALKCPKLSKNSCAQPVYTPPQVPSTPRPRK